MVVKECTVPVSWLPYLADENDGMPSNPEINTLLLDTCPQGHYLYTITAPLSYDNVSEGQTEINVFMIYKPLVRTIQYQF